MVEPFAATRRHREHPGATRRRNGLDRALVPEPSGRARLSGMVHTRRPARRKPRDQPSAHTRRRTTTRSREIELAAARIRVPTLVLRRPAHVLSPPREHDPITALIPDAVRVELPGEDLLLFGGEVDALLAEISQFVTGTYLHPEPERSPGRGAVQRPRRINPTRQPNSVTLTGNDNSTVTIASRHHASASTAAPSSRRPATASSPSSRQQRAPCTAGWRFEQHYTQKDSRFASASTPATSIDETHTSQASQSTSPLESWDSPKRPSSSPPKPCDSSSPARESSSKTEDNTNSKAYPVHGVYTPSLPVPPGGTPGRTQPHAPRPRTRRGLSPALTWWRGEDLNLRPSGYEPAELLYSSLVPCSTMMRLFAHVMSRVPSPCSTEEHGTIHGTTRDAKRHTALRDAHQPKRAKNDSSLDAAYPRSNPLCVKGLVRGGSRARAVGPVA